MTTVLDRLRLDDNVAPRFGAPVYRLILTLDGQHQYNTVVTKALHP